LSPRNHVEFSQFLPPYELELIPAQTQAQRAVALRIDAELRKLDASQGARMLSFFKVQSVDDRACERVSA
jgi:hypothetical protein